MTNSTKYNQILDALQELLDSKDIQSISVSEIAQKAGIGKGSIYYYFSSKDAILDALVERNYEKPLNTAKNLAKLIREEGYTCKIVFLTGYDKFEYAKAAIQVHAEDYLLKPFQIEEVERLMLQIVDKIRQERQVECATEAMLGKAFEDLCLGRVEEIPYNGLIN